MEIDKATWWQTPLAAIAALALFVPLVLLSYALVWVLDLMQEGYIGRHGEGIGFFMRGVQYGLAAYGSVYLPHMLLRRSNPVVVATIVGTLLGLITILALIAVFALGRQEGHSLSDWLEGIASVVGAAIGTFTAAQNAQTLRYQTA